MEKQNSTEKKKKGFLIAAIVLFAFSSFWFFGSIGWWYILAPVQESNTTEYTATIQSINPVNFYRIKTKEHNTNLSVFWEEIVLDINALNNLSVGQIITFRIKNSEIGSLNKESEIVYVVALAANGKEIISIESYNNHNQKMRREATLGFIGGGCFFLVIGFAFLVTYIIKKKRVAKCINVKNYA